MLNRKLLSTVIVGAMAFALSGTAVLAQENQADQSTQPAGKMQSHDMKAMHKGQHRMHRSRLQGRHMMPATVTSVDKDTGLMKVDSAGMHLTVHFPPSALTEIKAGDRITLFLGFSKGDANAMRKQRMEHREKMMKKSSSESGTN